MGYLDSNGQFLLGISHGAAANCLLNLQQLLESLTKMDIQEDSLTYLPMKGYHQLRWRCALMHIPLIISCDLKAHSMQVKFKEGETQEKHQKRPE